MPTRTTLLAARWPDILDGIYSDNQIYAWMASATKTVPANVSLPTNPLQLRITVGTIKARFMNLI